MADVSALIRGLLQKPRDFAADQLLGLAAGPADPADPGGRQFHLQAFKQLGERAGSMGPLSFPLAPASLLVGLGNEGHAGLSEALAGRPFASPQGFDWQDLEANLQGLGEGLASSTTPAPGRARAVSLVRGLLGRGRQRRGE